MELFLKPFYTYEDADIPADSTRDWQCAVLSLAAHAFLLSFAVFCMPLFANHPNDLPKEEIIMVTMDSLPLDCATASAAEVGSQSMNAAAAPPAAPPAPPPEAKTVEKPRPIKRTVAAARPKPVNISPPEPGTVPENRPEPESSPDSMTQAAISPEISSNDTEAASSDAETTGSGSGSSEKGRHSGGGSAHGRGSGSGMGSGSGERAFGSVGGPWFNHRVLPSFPQKARSRGREGTVVLRLSLDHEGRLLHVEVVSCAGHGFDEEAVRAIQKSTFSPAVRDGRPVGCLALLAVQFQLE